LTQHSSQSIVARIARGNTPFAYLVRKSLKRGRFASVEVVELIHNELEFDWIYLPDDETQHAMP
jgi:hypothetical protein